MMKRPGEGEMSAWKDGKGWCEEQRKECNLPQCSIDYCEALGGAPFTQGQTPSVCIGEICIASILCDRPIPELVS